VAQQADQAAGLEDSDAEGEGQEDSQEEHEMREIEAASRHRTSLWAHEPQGRHQQQQQQGHASSFFRRGRRGQGSSEGFEGRQGEYLGREIWRSRSGSDESGDDGTDLSDFNVKDGEGEGEGLPTLREQGLVYMPDEDLPETLRLYCWLLLIEVGGGDGPQG
jgi:hypothetical protein